MTQKLPVFPQQKPSSETGIKAASGNGVDKANGLDVLTQPPQAAVANGGASACPTKDALNSNIKTCTSSLEVLHSSASAQKSGIVVADRSSLSMQPPSQQQQQQQQSPSFHVGARMVDGKLNANTDGYLWRKYGQKILKRMEHPRNYYRCSHKGCPVRKHVEAGPGSELNTVYWGGTHSHVSPITGTYLCHPAGAGSVANGVDVLPYQTMTTTTTTTVSVQQQHNAQASSPPQQQRGSVSVDAAANKTMMMQRGAATAVGRVDSASASASVSASAYTTSKGSSDANGTRLSGTNVSLTTKTMEDKKENIVDDAGDKAAAQRHLSRVESNVVADALLGNVGAMGGDGSKPGCVVVAQDVQRRSSSSGNGVGNGVANGGGKLYTAPSNARDAQAMTGKRTSSAAGMDTGVCAAVNTTKISEACSQLPLRPSVAKEPEKKRPKKAGPTPSSPVVFESPWKSPKIVGTTSSGVALFHDRNGELVEDRFGILQSLQKKAAGASKAPIPPFSGMAAKGMAPSVPVAITSKSAGAAKAAVPVGNRPAVAPAKAAGASGQQQNAKKTKLCTSMLPGSSQAAKTSAADASASASAPASTAIVISSKQITSIVNTINSKNGATVSVVSVNNGAKKTATTATTTAGASTNTSGGAPSAPSSACASDDSGDVGKATHACPPCSGSNTKRGSMRTVVLVEVGERESVEDGWRWRKYGQKVVKGSPYPRSYFKCTQSGCGVRKQVERNRENGNQMIITYEGGHNHEMAPAADAGGAGSAGGGKGVAGKTAKGGAQKRQGLAGVGAGRTGKGVGKVKAKSFGIPRRPAADGGLEITNGDMLCPSPQILIHAGSGVASAMNMELHSMDSDMNIGNPPGGVNGSDVVCGHHDHSKHGDHGLDTTPHFMGEHQSLIGAAMKFNANGQSISGAGHDDFDFQYHPSHITGCEGDYEPLTSDDLDTIMFSNSPVCSLDTPFAHVKMVDGVPSGDVDKAGKPTDACTSGQLPALDAGSILDLHSPSRGFQAPMHGFHAIGGGESVSNGMNVSSISRPNWTRPPPLFISGTTLPAGCTGTPPGLNLSSPAFDPFAFLNVTPRTPGSCRGGLSVH